MEEISEAPPHIGEPYLAGEGRSAQLDRLLFQKQRTLPYLNKLSVSVGVLPSLQFKKISEANNQVSIKYKNEKTSSEDHKTKQALKTPETQNTSEAIQSKKLSSKELKKKAKKQTKKSQTADDLDISLKNLSRTNLKSSGESLTTNDTMKNDRNEKTVFKSKEVINGVVAKNTIRKKIKASNSLNPSLSSSYVGKNPVYRDELQATAVLKNIFESRRAKPSLSISLKIKKNISRGLWDRVHQRMNDVEQPDQTSGRSVWFNKANLDDRAMLLLLIEDPLELVFRSIISPKKTLGKLVMNLLNVLHYFGFNVVEKRYGILRNYLFFISLTRNLAPLLGRGRGSKYHLGLNLLTVFPPLYLYITQKSLNRDVLAFLNKGRKV